MTILGLRPGRFVLTIIGGVIVVLVLAVLLVPTDDKPDRVDESATASPTSEFVEISTSQAPVISPEVAGTVALNREEAVVAKIIDGDTISLQDGRVVRYIGIDTPERVHPSKPVECLSYEASEKNKELVEGKTVQLEKDVSETDRYDRLLRYVYVDGKMVNDTLVREGYASASSYPPDVKYQDQLREAEASARSNKWGLWSDQCARVAPATTSVPTLPTAPSKSSGSGAPAKPAASCSNNTYNCDDFTSCDEVMAVFNACSSDVHRLDSDDDGVPCEQLCG